MRVEHRGALARSRTWLSVAAWMMLVWVGVGLLISLPPLDERLAAISSHEAYRIAEGTALSLLALTGIGLWLAALRHAALSSYRSPFTRISTLVALIAGNFVASFFYYFCFVAWRRPPPDEPARLTPRRS